MMRSSRAFLLVALLMAGCNESNSSPAPTAAAQEEIDYFWCRPDKTSGRGWDTKYDGVISECAGTESACKARAKDAPCYRQEIAFCYREISIGDDFAATCSSSMHSCQTLNHNGRRSSDCKPEKLTVELRGLLVDGK